MTGKETGRSGLLWVAAFVGGISVLAAGAQAVESTGAQKVQARIMRYRELGASAKSLSDQLRAPSADLVTVRRAAAEIVEFSRDQYALFPAGSGKASGAKTRARVEIWTDAEGFREQQRRFELAAVRLSEAASGGDLRNVRARARDLSAACGACHKSFRQK